ncbi:MAG: complex I subunit 5 family protein [Lachnospiraceae bacterium]|nr:complex I subunit 5 family protein [Lachnospiraceae bacterium]
MVGNPIPAILIFYPMFAAVAVYLIGRDNKKIRDYIVQLVGVTELLAFVIVAVCFQETGELSFTWNGFAGLGMHVTLDGFRVLYGLIAALMWMMTALFSGEYFAHYRNRNRYYFFYLMTLGATVGVFLSSDLYTTFLFFEIMSFTSYVWVAHDEKSESLRAAATYLAVAVIGGLVLLMGLFLLYRTVGTLDMASLYEACAACTDKRMLYTAGVCLLFGFGAKAGAFPLHIWLPKAHPVAPAPASALLSGILTKSGIFGILVVSCNVFSRNATWGVLILTLGVITMVAGAVLALFSVDLKRTLACSSMSQIGFVLVGVGMLCILNGGGNGVLRAEIAARGTLLHMVNHSLIKLVLFMAAGVVFMNVHKLNLNDIRGFGRKKPLLHLAFLSGALGIAGVPLFNGYISKTLLHESIVMAKELAIYAPIGNWVGAACPFGFELNAFARFVTSPRILEILEWLFLISGGLTAAYMLKLYICLFWEKNKDAEEQARFDGMKAYMNKKSAFAIVGSAALLPVIGLFPYLITDKIGAFGENIFHVSPAHETVSYFGLESLKGGFISLAIGVVLYFGVVRTFLMKDEKSGEQLYINRLPKWFDLENGVYRPVLLKGIPAVLGFLCRILDTLTDSILIVLRKTVFRESPIPHEREQGTIFTDMAGSVGDFFHRLLNRTIRRKHPKTLARSYRQVIALKREEFRENNVLIARSLSFGLLLFCAGFLFTVIYLLFRA